MDPNNNDWDPNATPHITLGRDKYAYIKYDDGKEYLDIREMIFIGNSLKRKRAGVLLTREEWRQFKQKFSNPEYLMVSFSLFTSVSYYSFTGATEHSYNVYRNKNCAILER